MSIKYRTRQLKHNISRCQHCGLSHDYQLEIRYRLKSDQANEIPIFGGKGATPIESHADTEQHLSKIPNWDVMFICPIAQKPFVKSVSIEAYQDEEIIGVFCEASPPVIQTDTPVNNLLTQLQDSALEEWVKSSGGNARDFCKTMLTTSTGAIPIFFAVLKYLGVETASNTFLSWMGIIPSSLFLASAVLFILAIQPQYFIVRQQHEFINFRNRRFKQLNRLIQMGTIFFILGVCFAIFSFVKILND